jgi:membrane associated rhomboid family serine protease
MASIWDKLVSYFRRGNTTTRLIMVTVGVFLLVRIVLGLLVLFHVDSKGWLEWLLVPVGVPEVLSRPWTVFTYLFVHYNLMHLLMNMVWLYFFGLFFQRWFTSSQLVVHYIIGGVAGACLFVLGNQLVELSGSLPSQAPLIGASAAVMSLAMAVTVLRPNEPVSLFLFGTIRLKYLALIMIGLDLLGLSPERDGVMLAHLGGALYGIAVGLTSRRGINLTGWFERLVFRFSTRKRRPKMKVTYRRSQKETTHRTADGDQAYRDRVKQEENRLDSILDKVKQSGYDSLSKEEKKQLFDMSNRTSR